MPFRRSCLTCEQQGPHCFCSLDRVALQRLDRMGTCVRLGARKRVLDEGCPPDHVYVLCRGTIKLTTSSRDGRLLILRIAGPGDVLGLAAALKRSPYEATAETLEPCELKAIPRTHFLLFMEEFQAVSRNSALAVAREYQATVVSARRLALSATSSAKLASVLVEWARLVREDIPEGESGPQERAARFRMALTHEELGHLAGISRETVTRLLSTFRRDGLAIQESGWMILPDLRQLAERAG